MKPTKQQGIVGVLIIALPIISSYLGIEYQKAQPVTSTTTNVAITALPAGAMRSDQDVKVLCKEVIKTTMDAHISSIRH